MIKLNHKDFRGKWVFFLHKFRAGPLAFCRHKGFLRNVRHELGNNPVGH